MANSIVIDDQVREMLRKAKQQGFASPESTLFSLGGKGHFENPLSDLLSFFLDPAEVHNLGNVFLRKLLQLTQSPLSPEAFGEVMVEREYIVEGGRIDILVRGQGAALVIENKVNAGLQNNLTSYEKQVRGLVGGMPVTFVVFAPQRPSNLKNYPLWSWVSFHAYAAAVERALAMPVEGGAESKWHIFAKELLLHMRQLQGSVLTMTPEQVDFVELNLPEIKKARELESAYRSFIVTELNARLSDFNSKVGCSFKDDGWGFVCDSPGKLVWRLLFQIPMQGHQGTNNTFSAWIWVKQDSESKRYSSLCTKAKAHGVNGPTGGKNGFWGKEFQVSPSTRDQAMQWLSDITEDVFDDVLREDFAPELQDAAPLVDGS